MELFSGQKLGHYEIISHLSTGGMGQVYKARDTRLDRIDRVVAIKVLRPDLEVDEDRRRRFEREARLISKLNHPHICSLYDVGREDGIDFLVMEYVDGETLYHRLARGHVPFRQAVRHAIEIADALDAAHRNDVIHRDLKPGNIMLGPSGIKLLDFGLARLKPRSPTLSSTELSESTEFLTGTTTEELSSEQLTGEGARVGTPYYMSPEQIEGRTVDPRTDVFAFGITLFELFTGRRPFEGNTPETVRAAILNLEAPKVSEVQAGLPNSLDAVIAHCLDKEPEKRWQNMHDILLALKEIEAGQSGVTKPPDRGKRIALIVASTAGLGALGTLLFVVHPQCTPDPGREIRFSVPAPEGTISHEPFWSHPAISPDGRFLAFVVSRAGKYELCMRPLDAPAARTLAGTEGGLAPFWSPDSRSVGFFADGKLKTFQLDGEGVQSICAVPGLSACGSWGDGKILFAVREASGEEGLYEVDPSGGTPAKMKLEEASLGDVAGTAFFPEFLPDGHHFLFPSWNAKQAGLFIGSIDSPVASTVISGSAARALYAAPGYLLWVTDRTLFARKFDSKTLALQGTAIPVAENVSDFGQAGAFAISATGVLVYNPAGVRVAKLSWFDGTGRNLGSIGAPANYNYVRISPDGERCAVTIQDARTGIGDIWVFEFDQGTATRLLSDATDKLAPIWSPDGARIVFSSARNGPPHLFRVALNDTVTKEIIPQNGHFQRACDWSAHGNDLLYTERSPNTSYDLWRVSLTGNLPPVPVVQTRYVEAHGSISPNGRWLAYDSDESGRFEVYVQPYPGPGEKRRVSLEGGLQPRWRSEKELVYVASDNKVMAVPFENTSPPYIGTPRALFQIAAPGIADYDISKDRRFLINLDADPGSELRIQVVLNWPAALHSQS